MMPNCATATDTQLPSGLRSHGVRRPRPPQGAPPVEWKGCPPVCLCSHDEATSAGHVTNDHAAAMQQPTGQVLPVPQLACTGAFDHCHSCPPMCRLATRAAAPGLCGCAQGCLRCSSESTAGKDSSQGLRSRQPPAPVPCTGQCCTMRTRRWRVSTPMAYRAPSQGEAQGRKEV